jgi:hypothetical protein
MQYYKITNHEEKHNDLHYKDGLNVDILPFDPSGSCKSGGIYFSSKDILAFLNYGPWIREVSLPEGQTLYTNPGTPVRYKAHKIILGSRREITLDVIKELVEEGADPTTDNNYPIGWMASKGNLEIVKYLMSVGCDPTVNDNHTIKFAAYNGHLETVKYLVSVGCDPTADNNFALRWAAVEGHLDVVAYLKSL